MKLFITGISGLLGLNLALQVRDRFQISGCYNHHPVILDGVEIVRLDLTSLDDLEESLRKIQPDVIVHTAGLTNVEECESNPEAAFQLNVEATQHVAKIASALSCRLVHISTDHLFDGTTALKTESDVPSPLNVYAKTKWEAEQIVSNTCPEALIIRTNFFGWGTHIRVSFSDWILLALDQGRELTMFSDVFVTPILIKDLVDTMIDLIMYDAKGIFHVAGGERLSKYDFANQLAVVFDYPKEKIRDISVEDFPFRAKRPKDMSLSSEKVERYIRVRMPTAEEGLNKLKGLEVESYRASLGRAVVQGLLPQKLE